MTEAQRRGTKRKLPEDTFCASCRGESSVQCSCAIRNSHEDQWKMDIIQTRRLIVRIVRKVATVHQIVQSFQYNIDWNSTLKETGENLLQALCMNRTSCTPEVVHELIQEHEDSTLDVNKPNRLHPDSYASLHYAAESNNSEMIRALLIMHADVSQVDGRGRTALMIATEHGCDASTVAILKFAAETDMDLTYRTKSGKDIMDYVMEGCLKIKSPKCFTRILQSKYPLYVSNIESRIAEVKRHSIHTSHPHLTATLIEMLYVSTEVWSIHKASVHVVLHACLHPPEIADSVFEYYS